MTSTEMFYAQLISIAVALTMVLVSWRSRLAGRLFFVLLFSWAAFVNTRLALTDPIVYLGYASLAWSEWYRAFIRGFFAAHITGIVVAIAIGQAAIALLVATTGRAVSVGLWGAIVFLLAIAPLGVGAGFPTTLIMAWAAGLLLASTYRRSVPSEIGSWWRGRGGQSRPNRTSRVRRNRTV
ncbi:MAG TPA: hypothetical protein VFV98_01165 [Vicinamibacterales bacterium]|nr:hypothetical protein [Vicinamibacterales bacterium]